MNPLNAELNPICHLLALLGAHHILHISRIRVNVFDVLALTVWDYNPGMPFNVRMRLVPFFLHSLK